VTEPPASSLSSSTHLRMRFRQESLADGGNSRLNASETRESGIRTPGSTKLCRSGVDLHQIRYFLAAAEHMNYARAARISGVHNSTLSRQVRHLEDNLGVSLFERHRNGIRLTAAGQKFFVRAQRFMRELDRAVTHATQAGRAEVGDMWLGVAGSILWGPLQRLTRLYRLELPDVELHCLESEDEGLVLALHERRIDVAVGYADLLHSAGVRAMSLWPEPLYVAMPEHDLLARRQCLTWREFAHQTVIVRAWTNPPYAYKELARRMPDDTRVIQHFLSREALLGLVAAGYGLTVVPGSAAGVVYPGVVFRPIGESDAKVAVVAAWLDETDNPAKVKFVSRLRQFAKSANPKADPDMSHLAKKGDR
jgi:DNA-binding transcriptional LysR family regulator